MNRNISVDFAKGLAILFVYLGHSILYHPISLPSLYPWCWNLGNFIVSFNMPLFFVISGFLFWGTKKSTKDLLVGKLKHIFIPYLFTMSILIVIKMVTPNTLSYNGVDGLGGR